LNHTAKETDESRAKALVEDTGSTFRSSNKILKGTGILHEDQDLTGSATKQTGILSLGHLEIDILIQGTITNASNLRGDKYATGIGNSNGDHLTQLGAEATSASESQESDNQNAAYGSEESGA